MVKKAEKPLPWFSSFVVDSNNLTKEELWNIILYTAATANREEKWEVEVSGKHDLVTGFTRGEDSGKFYYFLVSIGLDKKIEIIRGE
jgi:hypothetical protein